MKTSPKAIVQRTIDNKYLAHGGNWVAWSDAARVFHGAGPAKNAARQWARYNSRSRPHHFVIHLVELVVLGGSVDYTP